MEIRHIHPDYEEDSDRERRLEQLKNTARETLRKMRTPPGEP